MYKIFVRRTCELKAPFDICVEVNNDWTHFTHLHRRTIAAFHLLYKDANREIFLYKGRWLPPLPFYDDYVVFREDRPAQHGYRNIYVNCRSRRMHFLDTKAVSQGEKTLFISEYLFCLPAYWRWFPEFFLKIFKWIF